MSDQECGARSRKPLPTHGRARAGATKSSVRLCLIPRPRAVKYLLDESRTYSIALEAVSARAFSALFMARTLGVPHAYHPRNGRNVQGAAIESPRCPTNLQGNAIAKFSLEKSWEEAMPHGDIARGRLVEYFLLRDVIKEGPVVGSYEGQEIRQSVIDEWAQTL